MVGAKLLCMGSVCTCLAVSAGTASAVDVTSYGALRDIIQQGKIGAVVHLSQVLPDSLLWGLGAVAGLDGECTILGGQAWHVRPVTPDSASVAPATDPDLGAALLVTARVANWRMVEVVEPIAFADLDGRIAEAAETCGVDVREPFPFRIEGPLLELRWHVVDGSRLPPGPSSHEQHLALGTGGVCDRAEGTLLGFHSTRDQGVYTHHTTFTHIHGLWKSPLRSGHVDHVLVPSGARLFFPAPTNAE